MDAQEIFKEELELIQTDWMKQDVIKFLNEKVPPYFYTVAASSSGKYHPNFASGEGGLIRHTKMVVAVLKELKRLQTIFDDVFDCLVTACLIHDTFKHGYIDTGFTIKEHPIIAAEAWKDFQGEHGNDHTNQIIYECVLRHMGQWGPCITQDRKTNDSIDGYCALVHLADYIASRKFFDKFN